LQLGKFVPFMLMIFIDSACTKFHKRCWIIKRTCDGVRQCGARRLHVAGLPVCQRKLVQPKHSPFQRVDYDQGIGLCIHLCSHCCRAPTMTYAGAVGYGPKTTADCVYFKLRIILVLSNISACSLLKLWYPAAIMNDQSRSIIRLSGKVGMHLIH